jgi:hypothetical protein
MSANEHRWAASISPRGTKMSRGYCTAPRCHWSGTKAAFYRDHLYRIVLDEGRDAHANRR